MTTLLTAALLLTGPVPCEAQAAPPPYSPSDLLYAEARERAAGGERLVVGVGLDPSNYSAGRTYMIPDAPKSVAKGAYLCYRGADGRPMMLLLGTTFEARGYSPAPPAPPAPPARPHTAEQWYWLLNPPGCSGGT